MDMPEPAALNAPNPQPMILIVEDEPAVAALLQRYLHAEGMATHAVPDARQALLSLMQFTPLAICLDLQLPDVAGLDLLERIATDHPRLPVVVVTGDAAMASAVAAVRRGAWDYLTKPVDRLRLAASVRNAVQSRVLARELALRDGATTRASLRDTIGSSPELWSFAGELPILAASSCSVTLVGEPGTGRSHLARIIHAASPRRGRPLQVLDLRQPQPDLAGAVAAAVGSSLLVQGLDDASTAQLAALTDALVPRSGLPASVRLLMTVRRLPTAAAQGRPLPPLLQSLMDAHVIALPPLRARSSDIPALAQYFAAEAAAHLHREAPSLDSELRHRLQTYGWPGNLAELRQAITYAVQMSVAPVLGVQDVALGGEMLGHGRANPWLLLTENLTMRMIEQRAVEAAWMRHGGRVTAMARELDVSRTTIYKHLEELGLFAAQARSSPAAAAPTSASLPET